MEVEVEVEVEVEWECRVRSAMHLDASEGRHFPCPWYGLTVRVDAIVVIFDGGGGFLERAHCDISFLFCCKFTSGGAVASLEWRGLSDISATSRSRTVGIKISTSWSSVLMILMQVLSLMQVTNESPAYTPSQARKRGR